MRKKFISLFIAFFIFFLILISSIKTPIKYGLAVLVLCVVLWLTEAIPKGVTGLIPAVLIPFFGIMTFEEVVVNYMGRVVFLLISSFIIASAISKWKLDKKITYSMLKFTNDSRFILLTIILSTALMSAIIANTTAAAIMLPIGLSIIKSLPKKNRKKLGICILLSIAYAASIGGTISLIGTTPNLFAAQFLAKEGIIITFSDWLKLVSPFSFIMLFALWAFMLFKFGLLKPEKIKIKIEKIPDEIGAKIVSIIIIATIIVWIIKPFVPILHDVDDVMIGLTSAILLIITPIPGRRILLGWKDIKIPWNILLMFGGGLALGNALLVSGGAQYIVGFLPQSNNFILTVFLIASITLVLTEIMSNTAFSATFIPAFLLYANSIGASPMTLVLTAAVCSSFAFMLPIGTPPNAIVYRTKNVKISDMVKTGIFMNIISVLLWVLYVAFLNNFFL